jgi:hypothetical protein
MPLRRHSLGFTPTGEAMPTECTDLGVRMVQEQGGYTPIGCPISGKTDCYDIIDAVTGTVIIAKAKGKMPWIPQCGQWGYANPGDTGNCPDGQGMINGQCGKAAIACPNGDGTVTLLEITQDAQNNITGLTGKSFGVVTEEATPQNNRVFGKYSFDAAVWCKPKAPVQQPISQPTPEPTITPTPQPSEDQAPVTIDIQAFTPGGTGPIYAQPIPQQQGPTQVPMRQEPAPAKAQSVAPKPVEEKTLDTGAAVGIGAVLIAAAAAAFFGGK